MKAGINFQLSLFPLFLYIYRIYYIDKNVKFKDMKNKLLSEQTKEIFDLLNNIDSNIKGIDYIYNQNKLSIVLNYDLANVERTICGLVFCNLHYFLENLKSIIDNNNQSIDADTKLIVWNILLNYNQNFDADYLQDKTIDETSIFKYFEEYVNDFFIWTKNIFQINDITREQFLSKNKEKYDIEYSQFLDSIQQSNNSNFHNNVLFLKHCFKLLINIEKQFFKKTSKLEIEISLKFPKFEFWSILISPFDFEYPTIESFEDNFPLKEMLNDYIDVIKKY